MICFYCGNEAGEESRCPYCDRDQIVYRRIVLTSHAYYNDGLRRARVRDLSGAVDSLNRCLRFDKYHTYARNLLGLVYFEMGQTVHALREWVLSKNLQPQDNPVDRYLDIVQKPGMLNRLDNVAQKYNQALTYCKQDSRDLARIQLKRIISSNPKMIEAHQLLALILIEEGKYEEARKALVAVARIDSKNLITMTYMNALRTVAKPKKKRRRRRKATQEAVDNPVTNESVITPRAGLLDILDSNGNGLVNIVMGIVLGILIAMFLIVPTMRQNDNSAAQNALISANKEAANSANTVASLEKQVESLNKKLEKYTGQGDLKTSYEKLIEAENALADGDHEVAAQAIGVVNRSLLDANGQTVYDEISGTIREENAKDAYTEGSRAYRSRHYEEAIPLLLTVVEFDPDYSDGYALYYLAQSYENTDDTANAGKYYAQFAERFPRTSRGRVAASKAEEFGASGSDEAEDADNTNGTGQTGNTGTTEDADGADGAEQTEDTDAGDTEGAE